MDSVRWGGDGGVRPPVFELPNGDVWVVTADAPEGRCFRRHLGHVVEVLHGGRIRRVGHGLRYAAPWLLAVGPLEMVIERALLDGSDEAALPRLDDLLEHQVEAASRGLLGHLSALLRRGDGAEARADPAAAWHDTTPWTRLG